MYLRPTHLETHRSSWFTVTALWLYHIWIYHCNYNEYCDNSLLQLSLNIWASISVRVGTSLEVALLSNRVCTYLGLTHTTQFLPKVDFTLYLCTVVRAPISPYLANFGGLVQPLELCLTDGTKNMISRWLQFVFPWGLLKFTIFSMAMYIFTCIYFFISAHFSFRYLSFSASMLCCLYCKCFSESTAFDFEHYNGFLNGSEVLHSDVLHCSSVLH